MTEGYAALNGSGPQQIYINVYRVSQNQGGNYSTYRRIVRYIANGYGSWTNNTQHWSGNFGGEARSGTFTIPYDQRFNDITLLDTTFSRAHDANGYGTGFSSTAWIDTDHSSIGDGSVTVSEETPPRIPKPPGAPGTPALSEILPTSIRADWAAPGDDGGTGITNYQVQVATDAGFASVVQTINNGTSRTCTVTDLNPGTEHHFRVRAQNAVGTGGWSPISDAETLAGGRAWDGSAMRNCKVRTWDGSAWRLVRARTFDGTTWRNTR